MKILLLDNIRSMQNVGALFRNADGSGFQKIFLTGCTPTPPRKEISKTALGGEKSIDWEYYSSAQECLRYIKKSGFTIYSIELDEKSIDYKNLYNNTPLNICLILGNEINGVQRTLLDESDEIVMIPMLGKKESLNVSVAGGIVMYATVNT
ncbi:RNA methyltransferase [Candidatus Gracilibacteria bacterium]|nr:RNA methyltransferase [Candidatus Gracilibacteria bacterium]